MAEVHDADISGEHLMYIEELMKIFGIGRVKAYELYTKHDIKSINDLKKAVKKPERTKRLIWFNVFPHMPLTKKPKGMRMGKGAGRLNS